MCQSIFSDFVTYFLMDWGRKSRFSVCLRLPFLLIKCHFLPSTDSPHCTISYQCHHHHHLVTVIFARTEFLHERRRENDDSWWTKFRSYFFLSSVNYFSERRRMTKWWTFHPSSVLEENDNGNESRTNCQCICNLKSSSVLWRNFWIFFWPHTKDEPICSGEQIAFTLIVLSRQKVIVTLPICNLDSIFERKSLINCT